MEKWNCPISNIYNMCCILTFHLVSCFYTSMVLVEGVVFSTISCVSVRHQHLTQSSCTTLQHLLLHDLIKQLSREQEVFQDTPVTL